MTATERKPEFELSIATPYIALTDELWCVYNDNFE